MSIFAGITEKISDWIGIPGLIGAFALALAVWLYYDLVAEMPLNGTMTFGVGICSLLLVSLIKIVVGLCRHPSATKDDVPDDK
ncbi:MAG: hypothetical protein ACI8Z9_002282 [Paraglaciecola sp.]|jgi:hypothetical protein